MVQGKWYSMSDELTVPLSLRQQIFGAGRDPLDALSRHVTVMEEETPVGIGRLWWQDGAFRFGNVGVLKEYRNRGYGDLLVRMLLLNAVTHNASLILLDTPPETEAFFARYGFARLEEENAGETVRMFLRGSDVQLGHCGGDCAHCGNAASGCGPKAK